LSTGSNEKPEILEDYPKVPSGIERFDSRLLAWAEKRGKIGR
jgi:hypothetical protein